MKKSLSIILFLLLAITAISQNQIGFAKTNLNLRTSPQIDNSVLTTIPTGNYVSIINPAQTNSDWTKVSYNGISGFVYSKYITVSKSPNTTYTYNTNNNNPTSLVRYYTN